MNVLARINFALLCITQLVCVRCAIECQSRYYCRTNEVKYASMERIQNTYLNATPIRTYKVSSVSDCQKYCIRAEKCSSLNMKYNESNVQVCQLLDVNMFSNASLLVKNENCTHLYIPSPCSKNPCLNGGTCVPSYTNDSYKCECKSSALTYFKGINCEKTYTGYASAFLHWSFDDYQNRIPYTSSGLDVSTFRPGMRRTGYEAGRKTPVLDCRREASFASCSQFLADIPCINNFDKCSGPISYSIWMKLTEIEVSRYRNKNIFAMYGFGGSRGMSFYLQKDWNSGFVFKISAATNTRWELRDFGKNLKMSLWNHFVLTFDENSGICAYINGVKDACGGTKRSVSLNTNSRAFRLAGTWNSGAALDAFFDDFAIWKSSLSEEEAQSLYLTNKA